MRSETKQSRTPPQKVDKLQRSWGSILNKERLVFRNQRDLAAHYDKQYRNHEAYARGGYTVHGISLSNLYQEQREQRALAFLSCAPTDTVLDIGCGIGSFARRIAPHALRVDGIDIARSAITRARKHAPKNLSFTVGNAEQLPYAAEQYDAVVSVETIEHVLHPDRMLREAFRVLKPGGRFIVTFPLLNECHMWRIERALGIRKRLGISEHLTELSYRDFRTLCTQQGFAFERAAGVIFAFPRWVENVTERTPAMLLRRVRIASAIAMFPGNSMFVVLQLRKPLGRQ